jgi:cytochrome d ubiquinol oxidase subunit I
MVILTLIGLVLMRRGKLETSKRYLWTMICAAALPFLANFAGWIFTEVGRQPWVVQGLFKTSQAVSPLVSNWEVALTMIGYTLIYSVLAIVGGRLFWRSAKLGAKAESKSDLEGGRSALAISY